MICLDDALNGVLSGPLSFNYWHCNPLPACLINSLELLGNIIRNLVRTSILQCNFEGLTLLSIEIVLTRAANWTQYIILSGKTDPNGYFVNLIKA